MDLGVCSTIGVSDIHVPVGVTEDYSVIVMDSTTKYFFKTVPDPKLKKVCKFSKTYLSGIVDSPKEARIDFVDDITCYKILILINECKDSSSDKYTIEFFNEFKKTLLGNIYNIGITYSNEFFSWKIMSLGGLITKETVIVIDNMMSHIHIDLHQRTDIVKRGFSPTVNQQTEDLIAKAEELITRAKSLITKTHD